MEKQHEVYLHGNKITVVASKPISAQRWTIIVHILKPDGTYLPKINDMDNSYSSLDEAFTSGVQAGTKVIENK